MRLKPCSGFFLGLSVVTGIAGCGASATQQAGAAPAKSPAAEVPVKELQKTAPQAAAAEATQPVDEEVRKPATVAEAAQAIDLSTFPLLPSVLEISVRSVAHLDYTVQLRTFDVKSEYEFQRRNLLERGWQELPTSPNSGGYAEGQFSRLGFRLYVTVQLHDEPAKAVVQLQNFSNVNVSKLPVPPGAKFRKASYNVASFETDAGVEQTREAVRQLLLAQGWQPYGVRGRSLDLKQNAVLLTATVAPLAQAGETRIAYSTIQMSADLPVPPDADSILYYDKTRLLEFIATGTADDVAAFYQTELAMAQWKPTTEKAVKDGGQLLLVFRNPANDLLRLKMTIRSRGGTRVTLKHQSAAELEESAKRLKTEKK